MCVIAQCAADTIQGEYWMITYVGNITPKKLAMCGRNVMGAKREKKVGSLCTTKSRAAVELYAQRMFVLRTKVAGDVVHMRKGQELDVDGHGQLEVDQLERLLGVAQILDVGRQVSNVGHTFIKRNVASSYNASSGRIKVYRSSHGIVITKKDTRAGMDIQFDIAISRRENVDATTEYAE